jgi:hypothetical protein
VLQDVTEAFVTPKAALRDYGLQIVEPRPGEFEIAGAPGRTA